MKCFLGTVVFVSLLWTVCSISLSSYPTDECSGMSLRKSSPPPSSFEHVQGSYRQVQLPAACNRKILINCCYFIRVKLTTNYKQQKVYKSVCVCVCVCVRVCVCHVYKSAVFSCSSALQYYTTVLYYYYTVV